MDNIGQSFLALAKHLNEVRQELDKGQFLPEQVCSEIFRLVDEVRQEQKRCIQTLQDAGVKDPVCCSIAEFKTQMGDWRLTGHERISVPFFHVWQIYSQAEPVVPAD